MKIKFEWLPSSWGLKGKTRERAKAEYELSGYQLEHRLLEIDKDTMSEVQFKRKKLEIDKKYGVVDLPTYEEISVELMDESYEKERRKLQLRLTRRTIKEEDFNYSMAIIDLRESRDRGRISSDTYDVESAIAVIDHRFKKHEIDEFERDKSIATLRKEPWVIVKDMDFNSSGNSSVGSFSLDWNKYFVEKLRAEGYVGNSDDHVIDQWFMEVCKSVALTHFDGVGTFNEDAAASADIARLIAQGKK